MKNLNANILSAVALAVLLPFSSALSQNSKPAPAQAKTQPQAVRGTDPFDPDPSGNITRQALMRDEALVTIDFPGGTIAQYVDVLRAATASKPCNVIVTEQAAVLKVPPIKLTNASVWSAISSLIRSGLEPDGRYLNVNVSALDAPENGAPTYRIQAQYLNQSGSGKPNVSAFVVLSLNPIIGLPGTTQAKDCKLDAKTVLSAVEAAVMAAEEKPASAPMLKFHEPSGLLFVRGSAIQQAAAEEVVRQLRKDVEAARSADLAATERRSTEKLELRGEVPEELAQRLRKQFEGRCCVQFEAEGKYLIMRGDRELVNEAYQLAIEKDTAAAKRMAEDPSKK